ncbi:LysE family translocator [Amycolatopsis sp. QT-25]|uniref:LysE family translocator n=1 Tax=Amycolatopsis sp. QT-25 TaxID=3034022 RepID=UPI0023EA871B|nr:LysE family translocator [Amycolatopsis sp. QT-25]WET76732.1 LysE family translocator [Amycolatopsis sp. QT-25]
MISAGQLAPFAALTFLMVIIPGPSVLFTISRALTAGRRDALLTVAGNAAGVYTQVAAVAFGLGTIVSNSAAVFTAVKLAGALYLIYLGVQALRKRRKLTEVFASEVRAAPGHTLSVLRDGFVLGFANPKSIVFLAAILPQFVDTQAGTTSTQMLLLGICLPIIALICDSTWAFIASQARTWFARSPRRLELLGGTSGLTMIGLGASLALSERQN